MADIPHILGQLNPSAGTAPQLLYTVPAATYALVRVLVTNRVGTPTPFRISAAPLGAADDPKQYVAYDLPLGANDTWESLPLTLNATDVVRVSASGGNATFQAFGIEIAAAPGTAGAGGGFGQLSPLTVPQLVNFAWVNQGGAVATQEADGIYITCPAEAGNNMHILRWVPPSGLATPWRIIAGCQVVMRALNSQEAGVLFRESSSGKLVVWGYRCFNGPGTYSYQWASPTANASQYVADQPWMQQSPLIWLILTDDGTNRTVRLSSDSITGHDLMVHSISRSDYLIPDQAAFYVNPGGSNQPFAVKLLHWAQS